MNTLFSYCTSLTELPDISKWNTKNVIDFGCVFMCCSSLKKLPDISKWNTENAINMNAIFFNCSELTYLPDISKWKTDNVLIFSTLFGLCSSLKEIPDISNWNIFNKINSIDPLLKKYESLFSKIELDNDFDFSKEEVIKSSELKLFFENSKYQSSLSGKKNFVVN